MDSHTIMTRHGSVEVTVEQHGEGRPFLFLHGGAGPLSVSGFAGTLAAEHGAGVLVPTHPGFNGTARPVWLDDVRALAAVYVQLVEDLDLDDVTVLGSSIGGWIAAEMALLGSPRV